MTHPNPFHMYLHTGMSAFTISEAWRIHPHLDVKSKRDACEHAQALLRGKGVQWCELAAIVMDSSKTVEQEQRMKLALSEHMESRMINADEHI